MDKLEQMRAAVARLNEAADAYYNGRSELMTDFELTSSGTPSSTR